MKKLLCLLGGAMLAFHVQSQEIKPLSIGDTVPDIELTNILNYKTSNTRFSNFKGPIIIDFFATWCGPCVEALPHLDSLQKQFGDSIQIFVVSHEPVHKIVSFLANSSIGRNLKLPFIGNDSILRKCFPHSTVPHEVIIKDGKVSAITFTEYINAEAIRKLCIAGEVYLPLKRDFLNFDRQKSLFNNEIGNSLEMTISQFLLTKYIEGLGGKSGIIYNADSTRKRIYDTNGFMIGYFLRAAGFQDNFNRVILDVSDSSKYIRNNENWVEWARDNYYSLEMVVPAEWTYAQVNSWMLKEFNLCLDVQLSLQYRDIPCWILEKTNSNEFNRKSELSPKTKAKIWKAHHWENYNDSKLLKDSLKEYNFSAISKLIVVLNRQKVGRPLVSVVLDETHDTSSVNIQLSLKNIQNLPETAKALEKYGLTLVPAIRKVKMLVVQEKRKQLKALNLNTGF